VSELIAIHWDDKNDKLTLLDQRVLPNEIKYLAYHTLEEVEEAIKDMVVRGAPAIGVTAAYGLYLGAKYLPEDSFESFWEGLKQKSVYLKNSRPTAVNLSWALRRIEGKALKMKSQEIKEIKKAIKEESRRIHQEDMEICRQIGQNFLPLLKDCMSIMTHCNAGQLATSKYGTATSPLYLAQEKGSPFKVYANETRPRLQGSTLTALELYSAGIDVTLITDNMAAMVMSQGEIDAVIVGCDRVAANGDTANKIGTLSLSILAKYYGVPFYVATPTPTVDLEVPSGKEIPIEERDAKEITCRFGVWTAPKGVKVYNPAFDVTPHENIDAMVTEKGVVYPPLGDGLKKIVEEE